MMTWQDKFCSLLFPPSTEGLEIEKAYDLKFEFLPKSIYKYRSVSDVNIANLGDDKIWMSDSANFNDPFDTAVTANFEGLTVASLKRNFDKVFGPGIEKHKIPEGVVKAARDADDPRTVFLHYSIAIGEVKPENADSLAKALDGAVQEQYKDLDEFYTQVARHGLKIHSFSERNDSILMWSHYADSHKGFLIEYDMTNVPKKNFESRFLFPVIYSDKLLDTTEYVAAIQEIKGNPLYPIKAALYKSIDWAYEKEWRWVVMGGVIQEGLQPFLPAKALYLGAKISMANERRLVELARNKGISVKKMRLASKNFEMEPYSVKV